MEMNIAVMAEQSRARARCLKTFAKFEAAAEGEPHIWEFVRQLLKAFDKELQGNDTSCAWLATTAIETAIMVGAANPTYGGAQIDEEAAKSFAFAMSSLVFRLFRFPENQRTTVNELKLLGSFLDKIYPFRLSSDSDPVKGVRVAIEEMFREISTVVDAAGSGHEMAS